MDSSKAEPRQPVRTLVALRPGELAAARLGRTHRRMAAWVLPVLALAFWWLVTVTGQVERFFLPSPGATLSAAWEMIWTVDLWEDIGYSLFRIVVGFALAAAAAVPCGVLMGRSRLGNALLLPAVSFIRFVPMAAVIPLMILWFGSGEWGKVMTICLGVFFQLVLMIADAIAYVPEAYYDIAHSVGATPRQRLIHFTLPAAAPGIWDSLRINFGLAWATLIFAEILGATAGLGYLIVRSQRFLLTDRVFVAVLVIGLFGIVTDKLFEWGYRLWFPWSVQVQRAEARL